MGRPRKLVSRFVHGWASTPAPTLKQTVFEPGGARIAVPLPLLLEHEALVGWVYAALASERGIYIAAELGSRCPLADEAWQGIEACEFGLSICPAKGATVAESAGEPRRFVDWKLAEVSLVRRPANPQACITFAIEIEGRRLPRPFPFMT